MKRFAIIAGLALIAAACAPKWDGKLTILHFNDTHSHFEPVFVDSVNAIRGGVIERAVFIDSVRKANGPENVLLIHAGDFSQGSPYFTELHGDLEIATINAMGYDAVCLGNHEFDNGIEDMVRRVSMLNCPVVCANYDFRTFDTEGHIKPWITIEKAGMKIGITGLLCDLSSVIDPDQAARLPKYNDAEVINKWAQYLKEDEKCDLVISLNHIGFEDEPYMDWMMVNDTRNVDLVVGGHSHTFLNKIEYAKNLDGKEIPIVQNGCWGLNGAELKVGKN